MTQLPPPQRSDQQAWQLDYASPMIDRPAGGVGYGGQLALGFAAFVATGVAGVVITGIIGSATNGQNGIFLIGPVVTLAGLVYLTVVARRRWRWRGFIVGVLIGLGLVLLAVGLCFVVVLGNLRF